MKRPFYLVKRGGYWYYRLDKESGLVEKDDQQWRTIGCTNRDAAEQHVVGLLSSIPQTAVPAHLKTFHQYSMPFFLWDECPHIRRVFEETARYTRRHARNQRLLLVKYILPDPFAEKRLSDITRADIFDLRSRLLTKNSPFLVNKAIGVVKIVLREVVVREELDRDPTQYVRRIKGKKQERGVFTVGELKKLFPEQGYGPWANIRDFTCFYLAAVTGARRGELLVLLHNLWILDDKYTVFSETAMGLSSRKGQELSDIYLLFCESSDFVLTKSL